METTPFQPFQIPQFRITITGILLCLFFNGSLSGQYFSEDFQAGYPNGWESTRESTHSDTNHEEGNFTVRSTTSFNDNDFPVTGDSNVAGLIHPKNNFDATERLITDEIDLSMATDPLVLKMKSNFLSLSGKSFARILVSDDGGSTWNTIHELKSKGFWAGLVVRLDYAGKKIQLAFEYEEHEDWGQGWVFDDIVIEDYVKVTDVGLKSWNDEALIKGGFEGVEIFPGVVVKNFGTEVVHSLEFSYLANGEEFFESFDGLELEPFESTMIEVNVPHVLGADSLRISNPRIANINGNGPDDNPANNFGEVSYTVTTVVPHPDKGVLVEEISGTWCPWSPRGYIFMKGMARRYPRHFVGVSVHSDDAMVDKEYDSHLRRRASQVPYAFVERREKMDPKDIEEPFMAAVQKEPIATLQLGGSFDIDSRELQVSIKATFKEKPTQRCKLGAIIVEDGVTGINDYSSLGHAQVNIYAGGGYGPLGGYELMPSLVPGSMIPYDGVGRALVGGFEGDSRSLPTEIEAFEYVHDFSSITLDENIDLSKVRIITVIYGEKGIYSGEYPRAENVLESSLEDLVSAPKFEIPEPVAETSFKVSVDPNPIADFAQIEIATPTFEKSYLEIYDTEGRFISQRNFGTLSDINLLEFNSSGIPAGTYFFRFYVGSKVETQKIVIAK